jgi:hypothetical protein
LGLTTGCGTSKPTSDPATVVRTYLTATLDLDAGTACDQLAPGLRRRVVAMVQQQLPELQPAPTNCLQALTGLVAMQDEQVLTSAKQQLSTVRLTTTIDGSKASVSVPTQEAPLQLQKIDGRWLIASGLSL